MLKVEVGGEGEGGETNNWARVCETCKSAPCTVYCRADSAYLCSGCDTRIHGANELASRHERVYVCEACERAPAAFLCKADAASLCASCDAEIHSANPLARRHQRVPIMPTHDAFFTTMPPPPPSDADEGDDDEAASWLLPPPGKNNNNNNNSYSSNQTTIQSLLPEEPDEYLDVFEYYSGVETHLTDHYSHQDDHFSLSDNNYAADSVVPVHTSAQDKHQQYQNFLFGMEFETKPRSNYTTSPTHNVPVSSMDVGVVPDTTISDLSLSNPRLPKGTIDLFSGPPMQMPIQLSPLDREARVMRYREKKKNRKFEKTIRYASRKAYAETRPRIKGRFAKRTNVEAEIDDMFPNSFLAETGYGIVPSF